MQTIKTKPAAQIAFAKKAAALKAKTHKAKLSQALIAANKNYLADAAQAAEDDYHQHDRKLVHAPRAPPTRLLSKNEVLEIVGVTYPSIWSWMRAGAFPRSRIVGGRSMWRSDEIAEWLAGLPVRPLKGDSTIEENTRRPQKTEGMGVEAAE
jgi:predicted DNA-binding transcriptional regulator AlpA